MNTAEQIILIILAAVLAILLILCIAAVAAIIRLVKTLQDVADKAGHLMTSAETVSALFQRVSGPVTLLKFIRGISDILSKHKEKE